MSVCQFEEVKKANQNENTAMSEQAKVGGKLKLRLWDQLCKRSSRELRKAAVMIVHVLLAGLPLRIQSDVPFSNISSKEFPSNLS